MSDLFIMMLIVFCIALEGLFSGGEIALVASDPNIIRPREKEGRSSARLALWLLERPEWFLATTLTGTILCVTTIQQPDRDVHPVGGLWDRWRLRFSSLRQASLEGRQG